MTIIAVTFVWEVSALGVYLAVGVLLGALVPREFLGISLEVVR